MEKVSKRGGFSDRNGLKSISTEIQLQNFDFRTRIQLQNLISTLYKSVYNNNLYFMEEHIQEFIKYVRGTIYSQPIDVRKIYHDDDIFNMINNTIVNDDFDDVLTLIEALVQFWDQYLKFNNRFDYYNDYTNEYTKKSIYEIVNECFRREYLGYRFVDEIIIPISDENEVVTLKEALQTKYKPVYEHLSKANKYISDRIKPDYENSIKESISAVEAMCEIITGQKGKNANLGNMIKKIENNGITIHSGLKNAFMNLYGYTSDANGIRHAGDIGGPLATFEEAKFMLVSCSAFINYLTAISAKKL